MGTCCDADDFCDCDDLDPADLWAGVTAVVLGLSVADLLLCG